MSGDWNADGKDGIGCYRPSTSTHFLRNDLTVGLADYIVTFGVASDVGVAGDWNLDGVSSAGVYRASDGRFHVTNRNVVGTVPEDGAYPLGIANDVPLTGDWTRSGFSAIGVFRPSNGTFYLKHTLDTLPADTVVTFNPPPAGVQFRDGFETPAASADTPLAGSWGTAPE